MRIAAFGHRAFGDVPPVPEKVLELEKRDFSPFISLLKAGQFPTICSSQRPHFRCDSRPPMKFSPLPDIWDLIHFHG
jgi:hypothetical protein